MEGVSPISKPVSIHGQFDLEGVVRSALSAPGPLREKFQACADLLIRRLDAAAARIWLVTKDRRALALRANSGARTTRIPVASPALRSIVETGQPYVTHDAVRDPHLRALAWTPGDRMAYAGYPLLLGDQTVGVLAVFSRTSISPATLEALRTVADMLAQAVERTHRGTAPAPSEASRVEIQRLNSLLSSMRYAIARSPAAPSPKGEIQVLRDRYASLSLREREVMSLVVTGRLNKQVGAQLGISEITVKAHRGHVMRKMKALSLADLVKIAVLLQLSP